MSAPGGPPAGPPPPRPDARRWTSADPAATRRLGRELAGELLPDGALLLSGELGSGKTVLVQGLAEGLGVDPGEVVSPSFTLMREHRGRRADLVHIDLYRLEPGEAAALALEEVLWGPGVKAVEWAERLPFPVAGSLWLRLRRDGGARSIEEVG